MVQIDVTGKQDPTKSSRKFQNDYATDCLVLFHNLYWSPKGLYIMLLLSEEFC